MSELQLSHIALVGARIAAFQPYGITNRSELNMRRIAPHDYEAINNEGLGQDEQRASFAAQLPIWVHNIITDTGFPKRSALLMALRRFEGELRDKKENEVVSAVMSAGFKSQTFNPLDLPKTIPMRRRCSIIAHIGIWQAAYQRLEEEIVTIMATDVAAITQWCQLANEPGNATIEPL